MRSSREVKFWTSLGAVRRPHINFYLVRWPLTASSIPSGGVSSKRVADESPALCELVSRKGRRASKAPDKSLFYSTARANSI